MENDQTPDSSAPKTSRYIVLAILILSLILILFFGTRGWIMGSYRAECILNTRNVQQAVRADFGMNSRSSSDPIDWSEIFGSGKMFEKEPVCPAGGSYTFSKFHPEVGKLACTCSHADHVPPAHSDW
jgi:hypothetical protein